MRKNATTTKKAGRPSYKPTAELRRKVSNAAGGGMSHDEIATGLGISRNTLETYYREELDRVAFRRRVDVLDAMQRAAVKGNVAAQKAYLALTPAHAVPPSATGKTEKIGKKDQANEDAKTAQKGTGWDELLPGGAKVVPIR